MRFAFSKLLHMHQRQHFSDPAVDLPFRQPILLQTKGDILLHRHVRKQRVGLEHHVDRTLIGSNVRQILSIQHNLAAGWGFKTGQHAQQRGFATARCAQQSEDFTFINGQADIIHGVLAVKGFGQVANFQQRR